MDASELDADRGIRVTMMLADFASTAEGKLTVVGGGWNVTGPNPTPFAIAILFEVPWHETNEPQQFRLELIDHDGNAVVPLGAEEPVVIEGQFEVGRPPGVKAGSSFPFPLPINHPPLPLAPGGEYEWRLTVNGRARADWRLAFSTRPDAQPPAE